MKKWLKRLAFFVLAIMLLAIAFVFFDGWNAARRGRAQVQQIYISLDASEPKWRLDSIVDQWNESLPDAKSNAAFVVSGAAVDLPENHFYWRDRIEKFHTPEFPPYRIPTPEAIDTWGDVLKVLAETSEALGLLEACRTNSKGGFPIIKLYENGGILTTSQTTISMRAGSILPWRAYLAAIENRPKDALNDYRMILQIRKIIGGEPGYSPQRMRMFLLTYAVQTLERTLALSELKNEIPGLQAELESLTDDRTNLIPGIEGERAIMDEIFKLSIATKGGKVTRGSDTLEKWLTEQASQRNVHLDHAHVLNLITQTRDAMRLTGQDRQNAIQQLPGRSSLSLLQIHAREFQFSNDAIIFAQLKSEALINCAIVALACERYRLEKGHWPEHISDIPKVILGITPVDPFTNAPLRLKKSETGIEIYSVGRNKTDDGGLMKLHTDDLGIQLYDGKLRRTKSSEPEIDP